MTRLSDVIGIQDCLICGEIFEGPWNEGACEICRMLINATPEQLDAIVVAAEQMAAERAQVK